MHPDRAAGSEEAVDEGTGRTSRGRSANGGITLNRGGGPEQTVDGETGGSSGKIQAVG